MYCLFSFRWTTFESKWISTNFPNRLELLLRIVFAFPNASSNGFAAEQSTLLLLLLLLLQMKRLKWCCRENAAGAYYKIITWEKLVNVSQNCGRIEMSSAGVWMERGRKQFEEMVVDCSMYTRCSDGESTITQGRSLHRRNDKRCCCGRP